MQIVFVGSFEGFQGGALISFKLLSKALEKRKHEIYNFTISKAVKGLIPEKLIRAGPDIFDIIFSSYLKKFLYKIRPSLLHLHDAYFLPAVISCPKDINIPTIVTMRNNTRLYPPVAKELPPGVSWLISKRSHKIIKHFKKVDSIIAVSDYTKKELVEAGIPEENITVIYNLPPNWKPITFRKTTSDMITLLAPGRICKYKGFETLVKSVSLVVRKYENIRVIIAGRGPYLKQLKRLISHLNLTDYIKLVGVIPYKKIKNLYFNSDIALLMSLHPEPFSRVLLEAMAVGKPIIATNTGGTPEAVVNNVNGILVPPNDPEKTADAIIKLIEDPDLRKHMGLVGRKILMEKFDRKNIVNKTIELYEKVISYYQ